MAILRNDYRITTIDALPAQMALLDSEGVVVAVNRAWRRAADAHGLGRPDHGVGMSYVAVCAAADPETAPEAAAAERGLREVLAGRRDGFSLEYPCHTPFTRRWFRLMASPLAEGRGAAVLHLDITQLKLAEEALVQSDRRWRRLVQTLPDALLLVSDGRVDLANEAAAALLDFGSAGRLRGRRWADFLHPGDREAGLDLLERRGTEPFAGNVELRLLRTGGDAVDVEVSSAGMQVGGRSSSLLIARDVSRRKQSEEALQELNRQLLQAQKLEAVGRLAGGVAHDFNNLLTAINGFSDLILSRLPEDDPLRPYGEQIRRAGGRAAELTRQLLTFGRRQPRQPEALDLGERLRGMEMMLRRTLGEDVELVLRRELASAEIWADASQVEQALLNLVINARDAMPEGGLLEIVLRRGEPGCVAMLVRDTGHGMDAEVLAHIFEPFFTTKEEGRGTGLGLPMVYGIVEQAGGRIEVDSAPGRGTEFRVQWPVAGGRRAPRPAAVPAAATAEREPPAAILVVEDEPAVRGLVREVLSGRGHVLMSAADGDEALALADRHERLDLLLTDLVLPGMNGREVAARVLERHPEARVLFMTGYGREELEKRRPGSAASDLLAKPFSPQQLLFHVRQALRRAPAVAVANEHLGLIGTR
jgi:two-component system, cell cycle sensor histidine kinase and response regulator CckA